MGLLSSGMDVRDGIRGRLADVRCGGGLNKVSLLLQMGGAGVGMESILGGTGKAVAMMAKSLLKKKRGVISVVGGGCH